MKGKMEMVEDYLKQNPNDWVSFSNIKKYLDISSQLICSAIKGLVSRNIVEQKYKPQYGFGELLKVKIKK